MQTSSKPLVFSASFSFVLEEALLDKVNVSWPDTDEAPNNLKTDPPQQDRTPVLANLEKKKKENKTGTFQTGVHLQVPSFGSLWL